MPDYSNIELVNGALKGDARCEEVLYSRFSLPMFRLCLRYAANRSEAEDMMQEGFMRVFTDLKHYRNEGSLEGWIRKVMVRAALRWLQQRRAFEKSDLPDELYLIEPNGNGHAEEHPLVDESKQVIQLLQQLPPGYRTVLNLYAIEGYSHEEIAEILQISVGSSRSQLSKARNLLRKMLEKEKGVMNYK